MADENLRQEHEYTEEELQYVYENRRYVGTKETVGFVLWDAAQSLNINSYSSRFITNIVKIDLGYQAIVTGVNGVWDIVNDIFTAAIVEKTRTRWGKFRPYLMGLAIPGAIFTLLYWFMPIIFGGKSTVDMGKFIFFFVGEIIRQEVATFQEISRTGLLSTITPHPSDRTRLITLANFASGTFGEKLPEQIMTVLLDLIDNNVIKSSSKNTEQLMRGIFVGMGSFCTVASSAMSFWFFMNSKERIMQSIHSPSIVASFKSIVNNKPVLLIALSDFLSAFGIGGSKTDYYIDVLHFASMTLVAGIPAAPISPISYSYVPWLRRHFSSRVLYIVSHYISNFVFLFVFGFGCIGFNPKTFKGGLYRKKLPMFFAMATWEVLWTLFYGLRSVIGTEMYNEAMDYCEWKNGYRTEAMTSVAKQLAKKVADTASRTLTTALKKFIGYDENAYTSGGEQPDYVKFYLFAMFTIVPSITGALGIIPMLFYDLSGKKKELMYAELLERRNRASAIASEGDIEAMNKLADEQIKK
ncbi:MAG: MFS transporter [Oscillospiraceae bacterium]|nr:MFS transporter [Oscillospiraceae bacterium]